jgi:hypothetical protein
VDIIMTVTMQQHQVGRGVIVMLSIPVVDFEKVFRHET